ncbi:MAG: AMP-binding protein, partial [bacterium]
MHDDTLKNLWLLLQPALRRHGDNPAWICRQRNGRRIMTYRQLHHAALAIAAVLRRRGIRDGDTVA